MAAVDEGSNVQLPRLHFGMLRHRRSIPDVPEDVNDALMEHLNDPNYDLNLIRTRTSASLTVTGSIELEGKGAIGPWSDASTSSDAESQIDSSRASESDFSKEAFGSQSTYLESVLHLTLSKLLLTAIFSESPYPEVRAAVSNTDDTSMPVSTFRS
jgi:hypothetical protein